MITEKWLLSMVIIGLFSQGLRWGVLGGSLDGVKSGLI
jgi:hypothetical protein